MTTSSKPYPQEQHIIKMLGLMKYIMNYTLAILLYIYSNPESKL